MLLLSLICAVLCAGESRIHLLDISSKQNSQGANHDVANVKVQGCKPGDVIYLMKNTDVNNQYGWTPCQIYRIESLPDDASGIINLAIPENIDKNCHYAFRMNQGDKTERYSRPFKCEENKWTPSRSAELETRMQSSNPSPSKSTESAMAKKDVAAAASKKNTKKENSAKQVFSSLFVAAIIVSSVFVL